MSNFNYIKIDPIIYDWIEDNKLSQDMVSMSQLKRWAVEAAQDFLTVDASVHKIALLQINNTRAELPKDFHTIMSVAYRIYEKKNECTTIQRVSQYTQSQYGQDCDLDIRVRCNKCQGTTCNCNQGVVEVDVDRIWEMENPWYYNSSKFGLPVDSSDLYNINKDENFRLMSYSTSDFFNANYHLPDCVNLKCKDCDHKYTINLPFIETDIMTKDQNAELLIAYLGKRTDEKGDPMVPNIVPAIEAIEHNLSYRWYRSDFVATGSQVANRIYSESLALRDQAIGRAKTLLAIPDVDELRAELSQVLNRRGRVNGPTVWENYGPKY